MRRLRLTMVLAIGILLLGVSSAFADHSFVIGARDNGCEVDLQAAAVEIHRHRDV